MRNRRQSGFSMVELMAVMALMGITAGITALYLKPAAAPLRTGAELLEGLFRQARLEAMATTSAQRIVPVDAGRIKVEFAGHCSDENWTKDDSDLEFPRDVTLAATDWSVCFNSRGISDENLVVTLNHPQFGTRQVEVLLGGTTQVLE